jgi:exopolyphosphatase/guanosine-5'-triphosphate,3'-diphosphate pyrophosphatase
MLACIDLGSNSFHLLIVERRRGRIKIIERLSEKVQLGESVSSARNISQLAHQRGMHCLHRFKLLMRQYPIEKYWALGTNTFRSASNAGDFVHAAKAVGIDISIISGVQEASLIYAGVIKTLPSSNANRLIIDVGGGSTEIIVGQNHDRFLTKSLAIGSVSWRDRFFSEIKFGREQLLEQMNEGAKAARNAFSSLLPEINSLGWAEAYASSGTVKMLTNICEEHGYGQQQVQLQALHKLKEKMAYFVATGRELSGLKEKRRDLLLPGWCIMVGLMEVCGIQTINFSSTALREGMLDFMIKNEKTLHTLELSNLPAVSYAKH